MKYNTIREAAEAWVKEFNRIPQGVIEKLMQHELVLEITPPSIGDRIYIEGDEWIGQYGEITESKYDDEDDLYAVKLENSDEEIIISSDDFYVENENDVLPMWGTMWAFSDPTDEEWCNGEYLGSHLQEMADCGFRIYEQEDYGIIFGIDGCGYDFYESHWIPLYKTRGLHWHKDVE